MYELESKLLNKRLLYGRAAEDWVKQKLREKSWLIEESNWTRRGTEIDIIARKPNKLLFVEVKYRSECVDPSILLTKRKLLALRRGIYKYLNLTGKSYDTILVYLVLVVPKPEHYFEAQWWPLDQFYN